jgi:hypothetical protein
MKYVHWCVKNQSTMKKIILLSLIIILPIMALAQQEYYYAFMTTCGQTAWVTTHHDMSVEEQLMYYDHYEHLYCELQVFDPYAP